MSPSTLRHALAVLAMTAGVTCVARAQPMLISKGAVTDETGRVTGAHVGWQGLTERVKTDGKGIFHISHPNGFGFRSQRIIATKPGYRIASALFSDKPLTLKLERLPEKDNADYEWIDPHADASKPNNCANCHGDIYREWQGSAHGNSATNPKFLSLFSGDDGKHKIWNAMKEHPDGSAVCAACHAPTLKSPDLSYDIRKADGVSKSGIHCDYCHKVAEAPTDKLGTRFGRDGLFLLRPAKGELLTFGPLDDAVRKGESFAHAPFYKESRYCASCHEGTVFGVHAYGTYSEWLDSPAKKDGKQCQDCHMKPTGKMTNIAPGKGGIERKPSTLASHHTPGGDREMLKQCLTMKVQTKDVAKGRQVEVEIVADNVGHRVPTGFVDRHLVLVVTATDDKAKPVAVLEGPRLPASAGKWKDSPGVLYAKLLTAESKRTPAPFWLPIAKTEDTRLIPGQPDRRTLVFPAGAKYVTAQLWYRRFWQEVADARGWKDNDLLVLEKSLTVR